MTGQAGTDIAVPGVTFARINWGRPVVDCPSPHCTSALMLPPGTPLTRCWDCGAGGDVVWPANLDDIVLVLAQRPDEKTRNWEPGESVMDLLNENLLHGILPSSLDQLQPGDRRPPALVVTDDRIVSGRAALGGT